MEDYQLKAVLDCVSIYADLNSNLYLTSESVKRLDDYINTLKEKIRQYNDLVHYLNKEIVNLTQELNKLDL